MEFLRQEQWSGLPFPTPGTECDALHTGVREQILYFVKFSSWKDLHLKLGFSGGSDDKESACNAGFNPWVRKIPWRREWQSVPVFSPGELHGHMSLVDDSPWGLQELDTTE